MSKSFTPGEKVTFFPRKGGQMEAVVERDDGSNIVSIRIANDPFPVSVRKKQVSACEKTGKDVKSKPARESGQNERKATTMATGTKSPSAKELRIEARGLGIEDYEDMGRSELVKAIKRAKKSKNGTGSKNKGAKKVSRDEAESASRERAAKKSKASKGTKKSAAKAASKAKPAASKAKPSKGADGNPFRSGSNLHIIHNLLVKGGKRESLAQKLADKVNLHPYTNSADDIDLVDYDKRIVLCAQTLRDSHGYKIERDGRGLSGTIKAIPPKGKAKK